MYTAMMPPNIAFPSQTCKMANKYQYIHILVLLLAYKVRHPIILSARSSKKSVTSFELSSSNDSTHFSELFILYKTVKLPKHKLFFQDFIIIRSLVVQNPYKTICEKNISCFDRNFRLSLRLYYGERGEIKLFSNHNLQKTIKQTP